MFCDFLPQIPPEVLTAISGPNYKLQQTNGEIKQMETANLACCVYFVFSVYPACLQQDQLGLEDMSTESIF